MWHASWIKHSYRGRTKKNKLENNATDYWHFVWLKKKNINYLKRKVCKPSELASFILAIVKGKYKFLNGSCLEYNGGVGNILID